MSPRKIAAVLLGGAMLLLAAPEAYSQDRPDIPDLREVSLTLINTPAPPFDTDISYVYIDMRGDSGYQQAALTVRRDLDSTANNNEATLQLILYEPDKIQRKADKQQMKQKAFLTGFVYVYTIANGASFIREIYPAAAGNNATGEECRGQVKVTGTVDGSPATAKWKMQCKESVINEMNLNANELAAIKQIFGSDKKLAHQGEK